MNTLSNAKFPKEQLEIIEDAYETNPYPNREEKQRLAANLGIEFSELSNWFFSRRRKESRRSGNCWHTLPDEGL